MLKGFLKVTLLSLAYGLLRVIYGKEGFELRKEQEKNYLGVLSAVLSLILIFWIMSIMFLFGGITNNGTIFCAAFVIIVPVVIALWSVIARKNVKGALFCNGEGYKPVSGNLFINGDFSDNSGESMEQWYVGMNENGHPESGTILRPGIGENGEPVNLVPLSKSGLLIKNKYVNEASDNKFFFGEDPTQPENIRHYLSETVGEPWTDNAWNGAHSLLAYVRIKPDTDYYFSFNARTTDGSASVRYGAINMDNYVPKTYRTNTTLCFSGSGYITCTNAGLPNIGGEWKQYETVINSADGGYFIFNAYWLQKCSNLCLSDFRLFEVEEMKVGWLR